ncbi:MAG: hypothetical protein R6V02_04390 [Candidatus Aminicenantes bacterium]
MPLNKQQEELYRKTMEEAKAQLESIDEEMEKELQRARECLADLQESKQSYRQVYEGAAKLLGVKIEKEEEEEEEEKIMRQPQAEKTGEEGGEDRDTPE